jgi:hypothetical protein
MRRSARSRAVRLLRELLKNLRFRYFANESFLNAGSGRRALRDYWQSGTLPPAFDNSDPAQAALVGEDLARRVLTRRFQAVLDDLKVHPRYILPIGSRSDGAGRDRRLAQHFLEEARDRGIARPTRASCSWPRPRGGDPVRRHAGRRRA